jgi:Tfp pilus assembly protein PilE
MLKPNQKGFTSLETLFVCIIIGLFIGIAVPYYERVALEAKEVTLRIGLVNIRSGIRLYYALQEHYPADLKSLIHKKYLLPVQDGIISGEYLTAQSVDSEGNLLDPFGNRYQYNPVSGHVVSSTKGYEIW